MKSKTAILLKNRKLAVIVVNWNGGDKVIRCLDSLAVGMRGIDSACVVVDNASTDGSAERIRKDFPKVHLVSNHTNLGFAAANNQALADLRKNHWQGDYIFFLNNDTELERPGFSVLVDFMDQHSDVAGLTPVLIEGDGRFQIGAGGRRFTWFQIFAHFFFLNRLPFLGHLGINLNQARFAGRQIPVTLDWISGTAMLVRSCMMGENDFFPEEYFMYFEDVAASEKLRQSGRLVYYPGYCVRHNRNHADQNLEHYFRSLQRYLCSQGFSSFKLSVTRVTIQMGLGLRKLAFHLLAFFNRKYQPSLRIISRQMTALRNYWLP